MARALVAGHTHESLVLEKVDKYLSPEHGTMAFWRKLTKGAQAKGKVTDGERLAVPAKGGPCASWSEFLSLVAFVSEKESVLLYRPLPKGWTSAIDEKEMRYYESAATKKTQWNPPPVPAAENPLKNPRFQLRPTGPPQRPTMLWFDAENPQLPPLQQPPVLGETSLTRLFITLYEALRADRYMINTLYCVLHGQRKVRSKVTGTAPIKTLLLVLQLAGECIDAFLFDPAAAGARPPAWLSFFTREHLEQYVHALFEDDAELLRAKPYDALDERKMQQHCYGRWAAWFLAPAAQVPFEVRYAYPTVPRTKGVVKERPGDADVGVVRVKDLPIADDWVPMSKKKFVPLLDHISGRKPHPKLVPLFDQAAMQALDRTQMRTISTELMKQVHKLGPEDVLYVNKYTAHVETSKPHYSMKQQVAASWQEQVRNGAKVWVNSITMMESRLPPSGPDPNLNFWVMGVLPSGEPVWRNPYTNETRKDDPSGAEGGGRQAVNAFARVHDQVETRPQANYTRSPAGVLVRAAIEKE